MTENESKDKLTSKRNLTTFNNPARSQATKARARQPSQKAKKQQKASVLKPADDEWFALGSDQDQMEEAKQAIHNFQQDSPEVFFEDFGLANIQIEDTFGHEVDLELDENISDEDGNSQKQIKSIVTSAQRRTIQKSSKPIRHP